MASNHFNCIHCNRTFLTLKGLKTHERQHNSNNDKSKDKKYVAKRIANTRSVQLHRQLNPKKKFEDLELDTKQAINEAKLFENYLLEKLGLKVTSIEEKIRDYTEENGSYEETKEILNDE